MSFSYQTFPNGVSLWQAETLLQKGLTHAFSTRLGGVSPAPYDSMNLWLRSHDSWENVQENYRRFCETLSLSPQKTVCSYQIHTDVVQVVTEAEAGCGLERPCPYEADALITNVPQLALTVFSADCCTLLYYDPKTRSIGACHAGWRGTAMGIAAKTVKAMTEQYGANPADILVALGPSIGICCFETDSEVPEAMQSALGEKATPHFYAKGQKWQVDLPAINRVWLEESGILPEHIEMSGLCTHCHPEWFWSHRTCGTERGSLVAMIALEEEG